MPTFVPPVATGEPYAHNPNHPEHPAYTLFRHYAPTPAGINVWVVGGVVTTNEPETLGANDKQYLGSHIYTITDAEATLLTAAGYGSSIT